MKISLAVKEILGNRKFSLFFIFNIAIGLIGFTALDTFKNSFQDNMSASSKVLLTADLEISARRKITDKELETTRAILKPFLVAENHHATLYSMAAGADSSRLIELKAIESSHPFYGHIEVQDGVKLSSNSKKDIHDDINRAWVYPELLTQLKVKLNGTLNLGDKKVTITNTVLDDTGMNWSGGAIAPRVYVSMKTLLQLGLIKKGSTIWHSHLYKLSSNANPDDLSAAIHEALPDPAIRVTSHSASSSQTGRLLRYLNDYLGLVALAALFLSCLGATFLFRSYLAKRIKEIAILISLGMTPRESIAVSLWQLTILGAIAALVSFIASSLLLPAIPILLKDFLPISLDLSVSFRSLIVVFLISVYGSIAISLPLIVRLGRLNASGLFQEQSMPSFDFKWYDVFSYLPAFLGAWGLAVWQSESFLVGSVFVAAFCVSAGLISIVSLASVKIIETVLKPKTLSLRLALRQLSRNKANSTTCFLALGLGTLLINLIPQIKEGLETELATPESSKLPSLFMFDIQDSQVDGLKLLLTESKQSITQLSPMVRSRLVKVNGQTFKKIDSESKGQTREAEREKRQRNRGYNLSYRPELAESEEVLEGIPFSGKYDPKGSALPQISLEYRFASRLGLKLKDKLLFDIQGVEIEGIVVNLRKVKWTSFQPNFFIQFQPGVLEDAPKTFVASVPSSKQINALELQNKIVESYPNISIIDVSRMIKKILEVVTNMSWILSYMAWLTLFAGFVVLYSIAEYQIRLRTKDTALLKILGSEFGDIRKSVFWEFGILGLGASAIGSGIAILFSWVFSSFLFEGLWVFNWEIPLYSSIAITLLSVSTAFIATNKILNAKPLSFLQLNPN